MTMHPVVMIQDFYDFNKCALIIESEVQIIITGMLNHIGCRNTSSKRKYENATCIVKKYFYATKANETWFLYTIFIFFCLTILQFPWE